MMVRESATKNSSLAAPRAPRDQMGSLPRLETSHPPPGPGKGTTHNPSFPGSREKYASQRPSGENAGSIVINRVRKNGSVLASRGWPGSPSIAAIQISTPPPVLVWLMASRLPSGEMDCGASRVLPSVSRCATPEPSARTQ